MKQFTSMLSTISSTFFQILLMDILRVKCHNLDNERRKNQDRSFVVDGGSHWQQIKDFRQLESIIRIYT